MSDDDFDTIVTAVHELPLRPPAAVVHDVPMSDAVPVHIRPEFTRPYYFAPTRLVLSL